jgi:hypothetical protein
MKKLIVFTLLAISMILLVTPIAFAECQIDCEGCSNTIKVIPVGSTETGDPLVTGSPANLMIFHTGKGPIKNVWLLVVLNKPTYDNLDKITINGTTFMTKVDFTLINAKDIPPILPKPATGYPGSTCQYNVNAIKDKMDEKGNSLYYGIKFFLNKITTTPTHFTLAVELTGPADLKALILALGRYDNGGFNVDCISAKPFNRCSSFSKSTFVVPETTTIALAAAPFAALGVFGIRVRRRKKN